MAKLILLDLADLDNPITVTTNINTNSALIETALENTLSRDGTSPNQMSSDLDMNSHRITNLPEPTSNTDPLRLGDVDSVVAGSLLPTTNIVAENLSLSDNLSFSSSGTTGNNNSIWTTFGARTIHLTDRVTIGAEAAKCPGDAPSTSTDWLGVARGSVTQNAQFISLSTLGLIAALFGARSSDYSGATGGTFGLGAYGINDQDDFISDAYGAYIEAERSSLNVLGVSIGVEIDPINLGDIKNLNPYSFHPGGLTAGLWLASGGGSSSGRANATVALGILNNGASFETGIAFKSNALAANGTGGNGLAIAMAGGQELAWYSSAGSGTIVGELWGDTSGNINFKTAGTAIFLANTQTRPTSANTTFAIGNNFSGSLGEVNFWNCQDSAAGFTFEQKTGASTNTTMLNLTTTRATFSGPIINSPGASVTPTVNGQITWQLTDNTHITFKAKGSDGTVRSGALVIS